LLRPFLGTGVLGGFTTFSTFAVDTEKLLHVQMVVAFVYFFGTIAAALAAATIGERIGVRTR
jgi:CrcB protein